jgi:hypothetical protein
MTRVQITIRSKKLAAALDRASMVCRRNKTAAQAQSGEHGR